MSSLSRGLLLIMYQVSVCLIKNCSYNVRSDIDVSAIQAMERSLSMLEKRVRSGDVIYGAHYW
jgi:hypothetical protein